MVHYTTIVSTLLTLAAATSAHPSLLAARQGLPDPAGAKNLGNGAGTQFIGGQCLGAADCASGCCATLPQNGVTIGVCSGVGAQTQAGKQGCGFESGGATAAAPAVAAPAAASPAAAAPPVFGSNGVTPPVIPSTLVPDPAGAKNVGNGNGGQFITGECLSDADCASGCCALVNNGVRIFGSCSGVGANTQNGKQGCGFPVGGGQLPAN
ncbi:hypothetical protein B0T19DRAFT_2628 [Cercophora scortea]|uniref:Biotrophy-associated secreted protein 2 n=1 Tax=Cercophora scortea TaxID=314031 RepID=A0AAE0MK80_9PEZI|nr:hypothetical protein B0T19DRAFT_2628 [Cercophora scortea]